MKHDVFISFSFSDQAIAENIVNLLISEYGITSWICTQEIVGGESYKDLIPDAIDVCKAVVLVQSESSIASKEVPKEIGMALEEQKIIIPFRIDTTPLKGRLRYDLNSVNYIDATEPSFEERVRELAVGIKKMISNPEKYVGETYASAPRYLLNSNLANCSEIFYGRDAELKQIQDALTDRNVVVLKGMGGIGKSELARQYAAHHKDEYKTVVFARYVNSLASLLADDTVFSVQGMARKTMEDDTRQSEEEYAANKLDVLKRICDEHTLFILDNFDVTEDPMLEAFTTNNKYKLIVTSRCEQQRGKFMTIPVTEIEDDILRDMVVDFANPSITMVDRDDPAFEELFDLTCRHTLTLELVGRFMEEKCIDDVGEIVELLKERHISMFEDSDNEQRSSAIRKLFKMTEMSENEKSFLRCLALMAPAGVDNKLFRGWCGSEVFASRARLAGLGLIRMDNERKTIALHPIVREVVLAELEPTPDNCHEFLERYMSDIYASWNMSFDLKQNISDCGDSIMECFGALDDEKFMLYYSISIVKNFVYDFEQVMKLHEKLYNYAVSKDGDMSKRAALSAYRAGWVCQYYDLNRMHLWLEEKAYTIMKNAPFEFLIEYPHVLTNIATMYTRLYETRKNEEYSEKTRYYLDEALKAVLSGYEYANSIGNTSAANNLHIKTAGVYMAMANYYILLEDVTATKEALEKAKEIITPDMKTDYAYLSFLDAKVDFLNKKYESAIEILKRVSETYKQVFAGNNMYSLRTFILLAQVYEQLGNTDEAEANWNDAYKMAKAFLSEEHPLFKVILRE